MYIFNFCGLAFEKLTITIPDFDAVKCEYKIASNNNDIMSYGDRPTEEGLKELSIHYPWNP